jgi:hypothetical protein
MHHRRPNDTSLRDLYEAIERTRGGYERVARRFLPPCPAKMLIRLDAQAPRRAFNRRRLARLIDTRRVIS